MARNGIAGVGSGAQGFAGAYGWMKPALSFCEYWQPVSDMPAEDACREGGPESAERRLRTFGCRADKRAEEAVGQRIVPPVHVDHAAVYHARIGAVDTPRRVPRR